MRISRVAKRPVAIAQGVEVSLSDAELTVKGPKGSLKLVRNPEVDISSDDAGLSVSARSGSRFARAMAGTTRALINNMVTGVSEGFERRLTLVGVGYRARVEGRTVHLSLGYSHPIEYQVPEAVTVESPSQTELVVSGIDKQKVGQVAAELRGFRPPEPYKGKGVRYSDERIVLKEAKKK